MYRTPIRRIRKSLVLATVALIFWCSSVLVADQPAEQPDDSTPDLARLVNEAFALRESTIVTLQIDTTPGAVQSIVVPIDGEEHTVELSPHSVRGEDYQVLIESPDGTIVPLEPSPVRTVRGTVLEVADSVVAGAVQEDGLHLLIRLTAEDTYWLQPVGTHVDGAAAGAHVLYHQGDVIPSGGRCGNDATAVSEHVHQEDASRRAMGSEICGVAELGTDADQEFLDTWGSEEGVEDRINFIINTVNLQYESQVEISHLITAILIHTNPPTPPEDDYPYTSTSASALLNQFRNHWLNEHGDIPRDLAFLFTGKAPSGGVLGLAGCIGCVCTSLSFALAQTDCCSDACATDLTAHELAHLWDAIHCNCPNCTMGPVGTCANQFCTEAVEAIIAHRDSRSCLDCPDPAPTTLPFFDDFPTTTLNPQLWTGGSVEINELGIGEPSEPYSVNLDFVDELRSTFMDTSGGGNLVVSYWYQAGWDSQAPEIGDDLFVEYMSVAQNWNLLSTHLGGGPVNLPFQFVQIPLSADAQHDSFRLRFRADNSAPQDEWFVDDVFVGELTSGPLGDLDGDGSVGAADLAILLGAWGPCVDCAACPADLNGDCTVGAADLAILLGNWG